MDGAGVGTVPEQGQDTSCAPSSTPQTFLLPRFLSLSSLSLGATWGLCCDEHQALWEGLGISLRRNSCSRITWDSSFRRRALAGP